MAGFVAALTDSTTGITATTLWGTLTELVPVLVITIPFALGVYFLRKVIKKIQKGRAGI